MTKVERQLSGKTKETIIQSEGNRSGGGLKAGATQDVLEWDIFIKPTTLHNQ